MSRNPAGETGYLLVLITSNTCSHCISFKDQHLSKLMGKLKDIPNLSFLHINLPQNKFNGYFTEPVPKDIFKFVKGSPVRINPKLESAIPGYPCIFLFSMKDWLNTESLRGLVFNGSLVNGNVVNPSKDAVIPRTAEKIAEWVIQSMRSYNTGDTAGTSVSSPEPASGSVTYSLPGYLKPMDIKMRIKARDED